MPRHVLYDHTLVWLILCLSCIGLIMVTSSSIFLAVHLMNDPLYFLKRGIAYWSVSFLMCLCILYFPVFIWKRFSFFLLLISIIMLFAIPVFGISVNGASRWIVCGFFYLQPSELSKLTFFCYLSNYLDEIIGMSVKFINVLKPIIITIILLLLLLIQPDFGTVLIFIFTILSVLFISGIIYWKFLSLLSVIGLLIFFLIIDQPYRIQRVVSFWNPWKDPFGGGYQLIQSLVAFGRGGFFGQGLGNSIQKFEYLPEAHTDFIFAIIAEELGFCGVLIVLLMMILIVFRGMKISYKSFQVYNFFSGFLSSAISFCFAFQILINVGSVIGILPTTGSTLPLISYGGSSFLVVVISIAFLLRIDFELRCMYDQAFIKRFY